MIVTNKVKCDLCGDVIESTHRHDFKWCSCKNVAVDGGKDYLKRLFKENKFTDLSVEIEDPIEDEDYGLEGSVPVKEYVSTLPTAAEFLEAETKVDEILDGIVQDLHMLSDDIHDNMLYYEEDYMLEDTYNQSQAVYDKMVKVRDELVLLFANNPNYKVD